jgi:hypothetical protein
MTTSNAPTVPAQTTALETFPGRDHHAALRRRCRETGIDALADDDRWFWHAYVYGFRRVTLGIRERHSPVDPEGKWFAGHLADEAERYYAGRFGHRAAAAHKPPTHPDAIRTDWERIRRDDLTDAEVALALPGIESMAKQALRNTAAAQERWRKAFAGAPKASGDPRRAREIQQPERMPRPALNDDAYQGWLRRMGVTP